MKESCLESIKKAFVNLDGEAKYEDLYPEIKKIRLNQNLSLSSQWKASVRRTIEDHSSDSANYRGNDVFQKLGYGYWGLRDNNLKKYDDGNNKITIDFDNNTIEGMLYEKKILTRERNHKIALECKNRDHFTCQACSFEYERKIVECHHLIPLSSRDVIVTDVSSLITLCPTCHALSHVLLKESDDYQNKDILINKIKEILK